MKTKKSKTRIKIMHAAKCLCEEKGIENVTFSDIAEKADICRTTVFNHFATTSELLIGLCDQEIADIEEHCFSKEAKGYNLIVTAFDKLIDDTALYPVLTSVLTNNTILSKSESKSITRIEDMVKIELEKIGVEEYEKKACLVLGTYYGLINHYHSYNLAFDSEQMKKEFHQMLEMFLGGIKSE